MSDDSAEDPESGRLEYILSLSDQAERLQRIRALSDATLVRYYTLLSDTRVLENVSALSVLEDEIVARGLPIGRRH